MHSPIARKKYKTKFPVARIKKIMQLDEDVGKVAQATPVLISKALELFMQQLLDESTVEAKARNCKRITPCHMKEAIVKIEHFDFLRELVQAVPDAGPATASSSAAAAPPAAAPPASGSIAALLANDSRIGDQAPVHPDSGRPKRTR
ncbi:hypothetical protein RI367_001081 [Sorochytrium milnesiophthora]